MKHQDRILKAHWWTGLTSGLSIGNFGDLLSKEILSKLSSVEVQFSKQDGKLVSLGSIMHAVTPNDTVWGTGVNGLCLKAKIPPNNNVFNVRGPLTLEWLKKINIKVKSDLFFDPGILVSKLFPLEDEKKTAELGILPHFSNYNIIKNKLKSKDILLINPDAEPLLVLKNIKRCSKILSSSLHGIVCAESYGIPAVYYKYHNRETDFKYIDYYAGTGRPFKYCSSLKDFSKALNPMPLIPFNKIIRSFDVVLDNALSIQNLKI